MSQILAREIEHAPLKPRYCLLYVSDTALRVPAFVWLLNNLTCVGAKDIGQIIIVAETRDLVCMLKQKRWKERRVFLLSDRTIDEIVSHVESLGSFPLEVDWSYGAPMFSIGGRGNRDLSAEEEEARKHRWEQYAIERRLRYERGDATAFAPKKLQRGSASLIQVIVHSVSDAKKVARSARLGDRKSAMAGRPAALGMLAHGVPVTVSLNIAGAECEVAAQTMVWNGMPMEFAFPISAPADRRVKAVAVVARILLEGAQVGTIAFTRPVSGGFWLGGKSASIERLRRVDRVFLSYASADRDEVMLVASAYRRVGIHCFFDRVSLRPGEEWHPRLLEEIDRSDLFHLFWSQSASKSEWVEREAVHAITRRKKSTRKRPDITLQMLDGPPWAPHPQSLATLNFDDFERAALAGYQSAKHLAE